MRACRWPLLVISIIALAPRAGRAQWVQTNGPYGATVECIDTLGGNIFIGTESGVYESTDSGTSWQKRSKGLPNTYIYSLAGRGPNLFAGTYQSGVYRSTDDGATWNSASSGLPSNYTAGALQTSNSALFSPNGSETYMSLNDGNNWTLVDTNLTQFSNPQVATTVDSATYFAGGWITRTTDEGLHWAVIAVPPADSSWQCYSFVNLGEVFFAEIWEEAIAGSQEEILRSTDQGESWTNMIAGLPNESTTCLAVMNNEVFAGTENGLVYRSTDSAHSWQLASSGLPSGAYVMTLASNGTELLAGFDGLGMFRSFDSGATWSECNQGLINSAINAIVSIGDTIIAAANDGVFLTSDNGSSWQPRRTGLMNYSISSLLIDGGNLYAGSDDEPYGPPIFMSSDWGNSWTAPDSGLTNEPIFSIYSIVRSGPNLLVGTDFGGIFISSNNGATWTSSDMGPSNGFAPEILALLNIGSQCLAATDYGIFTSTDHGRSWQEVNQGFPDSITDITCLATVDSKIFASQVRTRQRGAIFVYSSGGWTRVQDTAFPTRGFVNAFTSAGNALFVATDSDGIFLTTDVGAHWINENAGLTDSDVLSLAVQGDELLAGTANSGVWRRPLAEMIPPSSVALERAAVDSITAYPDPATNIVSISAPTLRGEGVATLLSDRGDIVWKRAVTCAGRNLQLDFTWVPNGAYRLEVRTNGVRESANIVIQR